jgi:hypothetical protein
MYNYYIQKKWVLYGDGKKINPSVSAVTELVIGFLYFWYWNLNTFTFFLNLISFLIDFTFQDCDGHMCLSRFTRGGRPKVPFHALFWFLISDYIMWDIKHIKMFSQTFWQPRFKYSVWIILCGITIDYAFRLIV